MNREQFSALLWTPEQRRFLIGALLCLVAFLAVRLFHSRQFIPDPLPAVGTRASELSTQLDVNSVDADTLAAIPRLGEIKARAIVAYREKFLATHSDRRAFEQLDDLLRVKGIGVGTVASLRPYLMITATTQSVTRRTTRP